MDFRSARASDIDWLFGVLAQSRSAPEGMLRSYLWELLRFEFTDIYYHTRKGEVDSVFCSFWFREDRIFEEWICDHGDYLGLLSQLLALRGGTKHIRIGSEAVGASLGWELSDIAYEMKLDLRAMRASASATKRAPVVDYDDCFRDATIDLLSEEWWTQEQARSFVDVGSLNQSGISKVLVSQGQPVAFCHASRDGEAAWISALYVSNKARGKGYGRETLLGMEHTLAADRIRHVYLGVDASSSPAIQLYESLGFQFTSFKKYQFTPGGESA
jgi:ribosomal protein S18 acetylase RimI-like enzyme